MVQFYKPYTGYVKEGLTYSACVFSKKTTPLKKFTIFTVGRSGSSLLVSLLQSHQQIHCDGELFRRKLFSPLRYLDCKAQLSQKEIYGFKLNTFHFREQKIKNPEAFLEKICDSGYQIISLKRRNILRQTISHMYALHRNKFHHYETQGNQKFDEFIVDLDFLAKELELFANFKNLHSQLLKKHSHLDLYYEDDLLDTSKHQQTVDRVTDFLGIEASQVSTQLRKTTPKDLSKFIKNYDEVVAYLSHTKYADCL